jgi:hypothetical protein
VKVITTPDGTTIVETGAENVTAGKSFTLADGRVIKAATPHEAAMALRLARESAPGTPEHDQEVLVVGEDQVHPGRPAEQGRGRAGQAAVSGQGPGRRLTRAEQERGARMLADGATERDVARALGCSPSAAHRLRERAATASPAPAATPEPTESEAVAMTEPASEIPAAAAVDDDQADVELLALRGRQEELAAEVSTYVERCEASRQAVSALEAERMQLLSAGHDAQQLRQRRRDAEDDFRDSADAAQIAQDALALVGQQIAAIEARKADRALRAELELAVAERDAVLATIGERQRAAVRAVHEAAAEFTATFADLQRVTARVDQLVRQIALGGPVPVVPSAAGTWLAVPPDSVAGAPVALLRAMSYARNQDVPRTAEQLGLANGWLPPDPAQLEAEAVRIRAAGRASGAAAAGAEHHDGPEVRQQLLGRRARQPAAGPRSADAGRARGAAACARAYRRLADMRQRRLLARLYLLGRLVLGRCCA